MFGCVKLSKHIQQITTTISTTVTIVIAIIVTVTVIDVITVATGNNLLLLACWPNSITIAIRNTLVSTIAITIGITIGITISTTEMILSGTQFLT